MPCASSWVARQCAAKVGKKKGADALPPLAPSSSMSAVPSGQACLGYFCEHRGNTKRSPADGGQPGFRDGEMHQSGGTKPVLLPNTGAKDKFLELERDVRLCGGVKVSADYDASLETGTAK